MIKNLLRYVLVFLMLVIMLTGMLTVTAKIPREKVEKNIELSTPYLSRLTNVNYIRRYHPILWLDLWADEITFSMLYNIDTSVPLKSVMESKYYETETRKHRLKDQLEDKTIQANTEYMRYWHGMMIYVRPLLVFFNIHGIFIINAIIMGALSIILMIMLAKRKQVGLIIAFIIAGIMTGVVLTPFCLEYMWVFLIMLITSIISIKLEKKGDSSLYMLYFITGILACFFDFLTAELVTVLVPILLVLGIRRQEDNKENVKFIINSLIIWFTGYASMWLAKWVLASIVLKINAFDYAIGKALIRIEPKLEGTSTINIYKGAITKNIIVLFPFTYFKNKLLIIAVPIIAVPTFILLRKKGNVKNLIPFFIIAIIPYIRYLLLPNHSYCHYFFMFREQFPTIMSVVLIFIYGIDKYKMSKKIYFTSKGKEYGKRTNNIDSSTE